jgi:hypothetical protein
VLSYPLKLKRSYYPVLFIISLTMKGYYISSNSPKAAILRNNNAEYKLGKVAFKL